MLDRNKCSIKGLCLAFLKFTYSNRWIDNFTDSVKENLFEFYDTSQDGCLTARRVRGHLVADCSVSVLQFACSYYGFPPGTVFHMVQRHADQLKWLLTLSSGDRKYKFMARSARVQNFFFLGRDERWQYSVLPIDHRECVLPHCDIS